MAQWTSELPFALGEKVKIDNGDIMGTVIGLAVYTHDTQILVSWWNNGELREQWVSSWRCKEV